MKSRKEKELQYRNQNIPNGAKAIKTFLWSSSLVQSFRRAKNKKNGGDASQIITRLKPFKRIDGRGTRKIT